MGRIPGGGRSRGKHALFAACPGRPAELGVAFGGGCFLVVCVADGLWHGIIFWYY